MAFENGIIDFRSDTVTKPTPEMREAMYEAEVGDDVYGEDPTVNALEKLASDRMGKEAALFVASGTMGNLIAILTHCQRGDEAIMGNHGHTFLHEVGGMSALGGVFSSIIANQPDGTLSIEDIRVAIREPDVHHPVSRLIILENTQNDCGGIPLDLDYVKSVGILAGKNEMKFHMDGARIFNAAVSLKKPVAQLVKPVDSIMFCLSKGLCAPVGSMLCGGTDFIENARRYRKMLGGGMRQAGILAAAGIISLNQMVDRLQEDHKNASLLAKSIENNSCITFDRGYPRSNMVFIELTSTCKKSPQQIMDELRRQGILIGKCGPKNFRLVTHFWVTEKDINRAAEIINDIL